MRITHAIPTAFVMPRSYRRMKAWLEHADPGAACKQAADDGYDAA